MADDPFRTQPGATPSGPPPYGSGAPAQGPAYGAPGHGQPAYGAPGHGAPGHSAPGYGPPPQGYAPQGYAPQGYAPQGYGPQGYAPQGYGQPFASARTNGMAIASLVLGILWLYWVGSVLALVFGYVAHRQIRERGEQGRGMATAGIVLGWVGVGILALVVVVGVAAGLSNS